MVLKKKSKNLSQDLKKIEVVSVDKLKLWKKNPNKHDAKGIAKQAELIKIHGFRSPLVVWKKNMVIYKGNGTYQAALKLKKKTVPVSFVDFESEVAAVAYGISDNVATEFSEWDRGILNELLQAKEFQGKDIKALTGLQEKMFSFDTRAGFSGEGDASKNNINYDEEQNSMVRMVQLFFNEESHPIFMKRITKLHKKFKTDTITDTIFEAVKRCVKKVKKK